MPETTRYSDPHLQNNNNNNNNSYNNPLPLEGLKKWVLSDIYQWLEVADKDAITLQEELDATGVDNIINLFRPSNNTNNRTTGDDDEDDDNDNDDHESVNSDRSDADYEGYYGRVRVWSSSNENVDGFGTMYKGPVLMDRPNIMNDDTVNADRAVNGTERQQQEQQQREQQHHSIRIVYVISESWEGYGDLLWASSRHLGQLFADPIKCRDLLEPLLARRDGSNGSSVVHDDDHHHHYHPLQDVSVLELGAGCGVPSLMAMKCGAKVVCTDLDNPNRIRCIAESMERNWSEMVGGATSPDDENVQTNRLPIRFHRGRACPFRWGKSTLPVTNTLKDLLRDSSMTTPTTSATTKDSIAETTGTTTSECDDDDDTAILPLFDVICATDCLFMPWLHYDLLTGMEELLSPDGVVIIAFAIHEGYSKEPEVWPFVDKAKERGFVVEILPAVQLTPPKKGMPAKQGLVNMLRLTKKEHS